MANRRYLDANILLRYFRNDVPDQALRARSLLEQVEQGLLKVTLLQPVVFEVVFTLNRTYKVPKADIRQSLLDIFAIPGIELRDKGLFKAAFDVFVTHNVPFVDAYIATAMKAAGDHEVYSYDKDFDALPGITRLEP